MRRGYEIYSINRVNYEHGHIVIALHTQEL